MAVFKGVGWRLSVCDYWRNVVRTVDGEPILFSSSSDPCFGCFEKSLDAESNEECCGFLGMGLVMGLGFRIVLLDDHSTLGTWMMECFVALAAFQWLPTTFFFLPMKEQALYFL